MDEFQGIPDLLHEASLEGLQWKATDRTLRIFFDCLRSSVDDSEEIDSAVELRFLNVSQFAFYYSPGDDSVRPSEIDFEAHFAKADPANWDGQSSKAFLYLNSRTAQYEWETASYRRWIYQVEGDIDSPLHVAINLSFANYDEESLEENIFITCDAIQPISGGKPLTLEKWNQQYRAWWEGYSHYWDNRAEESDEDDDDEEEDSESSEFYYEQIPAESAELDPLNYEPPDKPPFQIGPTDAPAELLRPIEDYHTGMLQHDWHKVRTASPQLDDREDITEEEIEESCLDENLGSWYYIRQIDSWWEEGRRACVVARGIEHSMPDAEDPAENRETVITYGLRELDGRWVIWSMKYGWPEFGSAEEACEEPEWKKEWE